MKRNIIKITLFVLLTIIITGCTININDDCDKEKKNQNNNEVVNNNTTNTKKNEKLVGKKFTRTYNINHIAPSNDYDYLYITIRAFQEEEIETVKVKRNDFENAEVGNAYEIVFEIENGEIENNIKSIFKNSKIVSATKTDKTGLEQVNEEFE